MSLEIDQRLSAQNIQLPPAAAPAANYVPFVIEGKLLVISGQLPIENGAVAFTGKVGAGVSMEDGKRAARLCAINILAQAQAALGDLGRIRRTVRLGGFIASTPEFTDQHLVMNGASDLIADILGEAGKHARTTIGVPSLPRDPPVEVEAIFAID